MRSALTRGRICLGLFPTTQIRSLQPRCIYLHARLRTSTKHDYGGRQHGNGNGFFRQPPRRKGLLLAGAASLTPAVFIQLSEKDNEGTEKTGEGRMLEASVKELEIKKQRRNGDNGLRRFKDTIFFVLDVYIWEPLCTGLRFLHLAAIFVPVIFTVPAIWIGARQKQRGNERSGTLWWYWFLVKSMERAGPAFIKVRSVIKLCWITQQC